MLRITRQTDYGIVLMTLFTGENEKAIKSARDLAEETNLPLPTVSKILKSLTRGGLLASTRGVKGGYSLSRASGEISVANIIEAMEGPIAMTDCVGTENRDCMIQETCPCKSNWLQINNAVRAALQEIPLDRMSAGCRFDGTETLDDGTLETGTLDTDESTTTNELA